MYRVLLVHGKKERRMLKVAIIHVEVGHMEFVDEVLHTSEEHAIHSNKM